MKRASINSTEDVLKELRQSFKKESEITDESLKVHFRKLKINNIQ